MSAASKEQDPGSELTPYVRPFGGRPADDDPRRCTATSRMSGERCTRWAMKDLTVCPFHGGASVKKRAQLKLLDLVPEATDKLAFTLRETQNEAIRLKCVEMVYDRTGLEAKNGSGDLTVVREALVTRLLEMRGVEIEPNEQHPDDTVEAELVEDDEPDLDDLI